ncbi:helix-turn-helix domain-containing protein [Nocardioides sp. Root151]|uniref:helix-turn-helix domain-containing protein n=1 Tax=Nocardioides sp. Root151 TaxID=1736475 RepID=UPI000A5E3306|nr:helix-turn-helix domain-containing protein [Nocardioides sp. Root151]
MYDDRVRSAANRALANGSSVAEAARDLGVARATVRDWRDHPGRELDQVCPRCTPTTPMPSAAYAALLGFYLGDGCLSTH